MEFKLNITMGNDAMSSPEDVAAMLDKVAASLRGDYWWQRSITDDNGHVVGTFGFTGEEAS